MSKTPKRYENFRVFRYFCLFYLTLRTVTVGSESKILSSFSYSLVIKKKVSENIRKNLNQSENRF